MGVIEALNLEAGDYLASNGVIYPIVGYIGADGEECEWFKASIVVAGGEDNWHALTVSDFTGRSS